VSTSPSPSNRDAFAVTPVVDCEPPAQDVQRCRPPSPTALRRRNTHVPQRHSGPAYGGSRAGHVRADAAGGELRRRRAAPRAWKSSTVAARSRSYTDCWPPASSTRCSRPTAWRPVGSRPMMARWRCYGRFAAAGGRRSARVRRGRGVRKLQPWAPDARHRLPHRARNCRAMAGSRAAHRLTSRSRAAIPACGR